MVLARQVFELKFVGDATLGSGVVLGPRIPITGDGRVSWGPAGPGSSSSVRLWLWLWRDVVQARVV
jgi:hypothetical protein